MQEVKMVGTFELILHFILFIFAVLTPVLMYRAYNKSPQGVKKIVGYFLVSFFFSSLRWIGGSLARLKLNFTDTLTYNIIWTLTGILAAVFGLYASKLLLDFLNLFDFSGGKKTKK